MDGPIVSIQIYEVSLESPKNNKNVSFNNIEKEVLDTDDDEDPWVLFAQSSKKYLNQKK